MVRILRFYILVILIDTDCTYMCVHVCTVSWGEKEGGRERKRETLSFLLIFLSFLQESEDQGSLSSHEGFVVREGCAICLTPRPGASVGKHKGNNNNNNISTRI